LVEVLEVAASLGETDLFAFMTEVTGDDQRLPEGFPVRRLKTALRLIPNYSISTRLKFLRSPSVPLEVIAWNNPEAKRQFEEWVEHDYDVVWFSKATTFALLGRPNIGPTIIDIDDLEDRKIAARIVAMRRDGRKGHHHNGFFYFGARAQAKINELSWRRFQKSVARDVKKVVLCSQLDIERFGQKNAVVVRNGFEVPAEPAGRIEVGDPPTILLQGSLRYAPNADAARWLSTTIAPIIRESVPDLRVRLVGDPDGVVMRLDDQPRVTVVGRVPSMRPELAQADIVAVPLRYGSGTRVKILEAFAHRIPVVSTTIGAEGLGLEAGRHFLAADDPDSFAKACVRLLKDPELRKAIVEAAHAEFLDKHQWSVAREQIKDLFLETARLGVTK
jgi:glycosyltransferase involved in cell wall biosynthesis